MAITETLRPGALLAAVLATTFALGDPALALGQEASPAPQYSPADFAKSVLAAPVPCGGKSEAECEAAAKSRGFNLPTLSAKAVADRAGAKAPARAPDSAHAAPRAAAKVVGGANILVTFKPGSAEITPQGRANLQSVAAGLKRPSLAQRDFEIAGYTDPTGSPATNLPLSKARAEAVMRYLLEAGIEPQRLSAQGYGSEPLVAPDSPSDESNRRVELHRLN